MIDLNIQKHHIYLRAWSKFSTKDDKILTSISYFDKKQVVATEKMHGENTTLYQDYIHARSLDSRNHSSRNWIKNFWYQIKNEIPPK